MTTNRSLSIKTTAKVALCWTALIILYVLMMLTDGKRFGGGYQLTPAFIKTVLINIVLWTALSIFLYQKIGQLIHNKSAVRKVLGFFLLNALWLPILVFANHWFFLIFTYDIIPSLTQVYTQIHYIYVYVVVMQYLFLFSICYGLNYQQQAFKNEMKAAADKLAFSDMKMQTLQSQLSPHFLYNSLSSISGLIRRGEPDKTLDLVADLGDLLRFSIAASKAPLITLDEEIHFTEKYIDLQRIRFGKRYQVHLDSQVTEQLMCPPFILQKLVENAFVHAAYPQPSNQQITATLSTTDQQLLIQVSNPIALKTADQTTPTLEQNQFDAGMGMALKNLDNRLSILFQDQYQISQQQTAFEFQIMVSIPKLPLEEGQR